MPLHLNSMANTTEEQSIDLFSYAVGPAFEACNSAFATEDKLHFIGRTEMIDKNSGKVIGHFVYTIWTNLEEQRNELLDVDITLCNENRTPVHFLNRLPASSDSNEYYDAETEGTEQHFQLETVCRYTVPGEIVDTVRDVSISVFPFELNIFDSITAFNRHIGFKEHHPIGDTGLTTEGLSETFLAPGGIFSKSENDETYSFIVGTVESFEDVSVSFGKYILDFVLAQVRTAMGIVPVAMGRDVFDIEKLKPGMVVAMNADVKADLSKPEDFKS